MFLVIFAPICCPSRQLIFAIHLAVNSKVTAVLGETKDRGRNSQEGLLTMFRNLLSLFSDDDGRRRRRDPRARARLGLEQRLRS